MRQFTGGEPALGALLQVLAQPALGPHPQPAARVGAEPIRVAGAVAARRQGLADVGLEVGLLEPFAGPAGEHGRGVGGQPEERGDLARRLLLDGGVPQHGLPPLGQRAEGLHGERPLGLVHGPDVRAEVHRVLVGDLGGAGGLRGEHREVLDELFPLLRPGPARGDPPDGGHEVGAHRLLGPGPAPYGLEGAGEHLGGEVVGGVRVAAAGLGVPAHGLGVAAEQLLVRGVVAVPHELDEVGVGGRQFEGRRKHPVPLGVPFDLREAALHEPALTESGPGPGGRPRDTPGPDPDPDPGTRPGGLPLTLLRHARAEHLDRSDRSDRSDRIKRIEPIVRIDVPGRRSRRPRETHRPALARHLPGGQAPGLRGTAVPQRLVPTLTAHRGSPRTHAQNRTPAKPATERGHAEAPRPHTTRPGRLPVSGRNRSRVRVMLVGPPGPPATRRRGEGVAVPTGSAALRAGCPGAAPKPPPAAPRPAGPARRWR